MSEILDKEICVVTEKLFNSNFPVIAEEATETVVSLDLADENFVDIRRSGETVLTIVNGPNKREIQEILGIEVPEPQEEEEKEAEPRSYVLGAKEYSVKLAYTRLALTRYALKHEKAISAWIAHCDLLEVVIALRESNALGEELARDVDIVDYQVFESIGKL